MALGKSKTLMDDRGYHIREDVLVVGYDNLVKKNQIQKC